MTWEEHSCDDERCQCARCANDTYDCCKDRRLKCPDFRGYDPNYQCPGFIPEDSKELEDEIAAERCPACGGTVKTKTKTRRNRTRVRLECNGDCWTGTGWHDTLKEALEEWHKIKEEREEEEHAAD